MASSLFQFAQKLLQQRASRAYEQSPVGRAAAFARVWSSSKRKAPEIERALGNPNAQRLMRDLAQAMQGQTPERYSARASGLMAELLGSLGPLGEAIKLAIGGRGRYTDQLESAVALIRALGGEYLTMDQGSPHYQRGLQAARKILGDKRRRPRARSA
jgi:hypothetical protein